MEAYNNEALSFHKGVGCAVNILNWTLCYILDLQRIIVVNVVILSLRRVISSLDG